MRLSPTCRLLASAFFLLLPAWLRAQNPARVPWAWVEPAPSPAGSSGFGVATDAAGNVYVTGYFRQALTIGSTTLTADSTDAFLAKYTAQGAPVWARRLGSTGQGVGYDVAADAAGNCYVAGAFRGTVALNAATTLVSQSDADEFLVKFDPQGAPVWGQRSSDLAPLLRGQGPPLLTFPLSPYLNVRLAVDGQGNLYSAGRFRGTTTRGTLAFTAQGPAYAFDALVTKYTPQGQVLWARQGGGTGSDYAGDVAVDAAGNVLVVGGYNDAATFGAVTFPSAGASPASYHNLFLLKYDAQGAVVWGRPVAAASSGNYALMRGVGVDAAGNAYVLGDFLPTLTLGATTFSLPVASSAHVFLAKYDPQGTVAWARMAGSTPPNTGWVSNGLGLAVHPDGTTTVTGPFDTAISFGALTLTTTGAYNQIYAARYSTQGALLWAARAGGGVRAPTYSGNQNAGYGVALDPDGSAYLTGMYGGRADFGPFWLDSTATARPTAYVAKIGAARALATRGAQRFAEALTVAPTPAAGGGTVSVRWAEAPTAPAELRVVNALGQLVLRRSLARGTQAVDLSTAGWRAGWYRVQLVGDGGSRGGPLLVVP
ncbi:hypothetical protein [Hymenobacter coccineus]|nr:hypothetical protein [Hymenobacter coccineus]